MVFDPPADIWKHSLAMSGLMRQLQDSGAQVVFVRCDGQFLHQCLVFSASKRDDSSAQPTSDWCRDCKFTRNLLERRFQQKSLLLGSFLSPEDETFIDETLGTVDVETWQNFQIDDVLIGKYAAYEFVLKYKLRSTTLPVSLLGEYKSHLRSCLITFLAMKRIIRLLKPKLLMVYNELYSINNVAKAVAMQEGVKSLSVHGGRTPRTIHRDIVVYSESKDELLRARSSDWIESSTVPLTSGQIHRVYEEIKFKLSGSSPWIYSSSHRKIEPSRVLNILGLQASRPTCLVLLSSQDERFAASLAGQFPERRGLANPPLFPNQDKWLENILEWAGSHPDFQIIVRPHPREFPNHREGRTSQSITRTLELLRAAPANVSVNTPENQLSFSDVCQVVTCVLNGTSTTGLEALSMGLPVVVHDPEALFSYPAEFNLSATTIQGYFSTVESAMFQDLQYSYIRDAYRYINFLISHQQIPMTSLLGSGRRWTVLNAATFLRDNYNIALISGVVCALRSASLFPLRNRLRRVPELGVFVERNLDHSHEKLRTQVDIDEMAEQSMICHQIRKVSRLLGHRQNPQSLAFRLLRLADNLSVGS